MSKYYLMRKRSVACAWYTNRPEGLTGDPAHAKWFTHAEALAFLTDEWELEVVA